MNAYVTEQLAALADYNHDDCLVYGIGNICREDDGLGWAFIDWLEKTNVCAKAELVRHYQLQLEDADLISKKRRVLFVDATKAEDVESIRLENVMPRMDTSFTSHSVSIPTIMATCQTCFDTLPDVQLLTIKGYRWELKTGLSQPAEHNLNEAKNFFHTQGYLL